MKDWITVSYIIKQYTFKQNFFYGDEEGKVIEEVYKRQRRNCYVRKWEKNLHVRERQICTRVALAATPQNLRGSKAPRIINLRTGCRPEVSFTFRPAYLRGRTT
jgi:hypothetical protein